MKTMKYILLIICVVCASTMMAVDYKMHQTSSATFKSTSTSGYSSAGTIGGTRSVSAPAQGGGAMLSVPSVSFRSTSAMPSTGSCLSSTTTTVVVDEPETTVTPGPKRARPEDWNDPYDNPLGDAVLPLLLLAAGYVFFIVRKRRASSIKQ